MSRRRRILQHHTPLCAALCLLFLLAATVRSSALIVDGHKHRDFKREVEMMEEQWRQAQLSDDVATMDRLLSDDYVGISMDGEITTKTQQLDRLRTRSLILTQITLSDMKVKLLGQVAIVTSLAEVQGQNEGLPLNGRFRYTRVYQRLPSGIWKITNFELTRVPNRRGHPHDDPSDSAANKNP